VDSTCNFRITRTSDLRKFVQYRLMAGLLITQPRVPVETNSFVARHRAYNLAMRAQWLSVELGLIEILLRIIRCLGLLLP